MNGRRSMDGSMDMVGAEKAAAAPAHATSAAARPLCSIRPVKRVTRPCRDIAAPVTHSGWHIGNLPSAAADELETGGKAHPPKAKGGQRTSESAEPESMVKEVLGRARNHAVLTGGDSLVAQVSDSVWESVGFRSGIWTYGVCAVVEH